MRIGDDITVLAVFGTPFRIKPLSFTTMSPIIMCIDMDAFFASVEQQVNPKLRGKPIAVIGSGGRTVITTRSYEARAFGVKTGMNTYEAKKLCPDLILVVGDNEKYAHTCSELSIVYRKYTPDIEIYSIDEAFLDITTTQHLFGGPDRVLHLYTNKARERQAALDFIQFIQSPRGQDVLAQMGYVPRS